MSQDPKRKLSPEELLDAIEADDAADEADRILALSDEDLDRELREAGVDPEEVRAEGRAIGERAMAAAAQKRAATPASGGGDAATEGWVSVTPTVPPGGTRRVRWTLLLAATMAAAAAGGGLYALGKRDKPVEPPADSVTDAGARPQPEVEAPSPSAPMPAPQEAGRATPDIKGQR